MNDNNDDNDKGKRKRDDDDVDDEEKDDDELKTKIDEIVLKIVDNRDKLLDPIEKIRTIIAENIIEKDKTTPEYIEGINEIKSLLLENCRLRYRNYVNDHEYFNENIFNIPLVRGCNMLMLLCINKIDEDLCIHIIKYYGNFFELGETNNNYETALIISIKNNMFDVAAALLDYKYDPEVYDYPNMGQLDELKNTALDHMLAKIKYDDDGNIKNENNDIIIENIDIISELLRFHLNALYDEPHNKVSHFYINLFCKYRDFWRPLLEEDFINDDDDDDNNNVNNFIDFKQSDNEHTNKVCDDILNAAPYKKADVISTKSIEEIENEEIEMPSAMDAELVKNEGSEIQGDRVITKVPLIIIHKSIGGKKGKTQKYVRKTPRTNKKTKTKKQKRKTKTKTKTKSKTKTKTKSKKAPRHTKQRRTVSR